MYKENAALWKVKPLLNRLIGDNTWAPCGIMIEPTDIELFTDTENFLKGVAPSAPRLVDARTTATHDPALQGHDQARGRPNAAPDQEPDSGPATETQEEKGKGKATSKGESQAEARGTTNGLAQDDTPRANTEGSSHQANGNTRADDGSGKTKDDDENLDMAEAPTAGIVTHGEAQGSIGSNRGGSAGVESVDAPFIHPLFLPPRSAQTDRDFGLPEVEADDIRRLLQLYVQKQEEVCRGTQKLYEGLLKADRYRKTVLRWAKAEAHCGPNRDMSDGEDWYDKEEWGLTEDLKKGEDEVEEDTAQTQKKTRTRRN